MAMLRSPEHARFNADEPAKTKLGNSSFMLTSDTRTPKLPTIWLRSASAVSEFGHPPEASSLRVAAIRCPNPGPASLPARFGADIRTPNPSVKVSGRVAQRESTSLTSRGSQVRSLRTPPPSLQVSNSAGDTRICPANSGLFRVRPCLRVSLCKTKRRIWTLRLCIEKFRSRLGVRDRFDDWWVGLQFLRDKLHHPGSANRTFPARRRIGRFCGDFRPLSSRILVSAGVRASE